ncbi:hypothetical protein [Nocardia testacea]|uniref:Uncharacterized protein n=1 Tax=Nocardia testacea TaxID=248551 RepID=A0ABW7WA98_9NOCA
MTFLADVPGPRFPRPSRFLGRNYWPVLVLTAWAATAANSDQE